MAAYECTKCGACCVAPDIAALDKPLGLRCPHLGPDQLCTAYENRPAVCRSYAADELCTLIDAPTLEERVAKYLAHFELTEEARQVPVGATFRSVRAGSRTVAPRSAGPSTPLGENGVTRDPAD